MPQKNKKIAHVVCSFPPSMDGTSNSTYEIVKNLYKKGYNVTVFTPIEKIDSMQQKKEEFKIIRLKPLFRIGNAAYLPQLIWKLAKFDIVHLHYPFFGAAEFVLLAKILRYKKIKLIIHYHQDATGSGFKELIFRVYKILLLPILLRLSSFITCATLSYIQHSDLKSYYKKYPYKFKQTYLGVDFEKFKKINIKKNKNNSKIILFVGGLDKAHYFKGVDILLKAAAQLKKDYELHIVGTGDLMQKYKEKTSDLGIGDKVKFLGKLRDKQLVMCYNNCNILALPSINKAEAFGLTLLEAMACEKPVIASNLPGVNSVFEDNKQGLFVKIGNVSDLSSKIDYLLKNSELSKKMGENGRKLVEKKYSWKKVAKRIEEIYFNLNGI